MTALSITTGTIKIFLSGRQQIVKALLFKTLTLLAVLGFVANNAQATIYTFDDNGINWNKGAIYNTNSRANENGSLTIDSVEVTVATTGYPQQIDYVLHEKNKPQAVPEPATMLLFGTGLAGLATVYRKKMKRT